MIIFDERNFLKVSWTDKMLNLPDVVMKVCI